MQNGKHKRQKVNKQSTRGGDGLSKVETSKWKAAIWEAQDKCAWEVGYEDEEEEEEEWKYLMKYEQQ